MAQVTLHILNGNANEKNEVYRDLVHMSLNDNQIVYGVVWREPNAKYFKKLWKQNVLYG